MKIGRDPRKTASANLLGSERRAGKVDQRSRALRLPATTHLRCVPNEHPCMLEPAPRALLSLTYSPPRTIGAFGRIAGKWWLQQLVGMQQRSQHSSMPAAVCVVAPAATGAKMRWRDEAGQRFRPLDGCGQPCRQRTMHLCGGGSFSACTHAFRTLEGFICTSVASCARNCAVRAWTLPLWLARSIARPQMPLGP